MLWPRVLATPLAAKIHIKTLLIKVKSLVENIYRPFILLRSPSPDVYDSTWNHLRHQKGVMKQLIDCQIVDSQL